MSMRKAVAVFIVLFLGASMARAQSASGKSVIRLDPALDALVSADAQVELVKNGFGFAEGANWVQQGNTGYLLFSDIGANVIYKWTPDGKVSVYLDRSGYTGYDLWNNVGVDTTNGKDPKDPLFRRFFMFGSNGLTLDPQGRPVIATWAGRSIDRIEKDGKRTVLADRYEGKRLGGPNDVIVKRNGTIYFTDAFGGLRERDKDPKKELDSQAIYMIKNGKVALVISDIATPNGLALSPDEKYLYANGGGARIVRRYDVQPDDTVTNGQMLIDMKSDAPGITDGMRVDSKGNIYQSGSGGIWIVSPEGKHLGTILTPELVGNLTFGDSDYKTLYIAARTSVYKIRVNTPGNHY